MWTVGIPSQNRNGQPKRAYKCPVQLLSLWVPYWESSVCSSKPQEPWLIIILLELIYDIFLRFNFFKSRFKILTLVAKGGNSTHDSTISYNKYAIGRGTYMLYMYTSIHRLINLRAIIPPNMWFFRDSKCQWLPLITWLTMGDEVQYKVLIS